MVDYIPKDAMREISEVNRYVNVQSYSRYISPQPLSGGVFADLYSKDDKSCEWYKPLGSSRPVSFGTPL